MFPHTLGCVRKHERGAWMVIGRKSLEVLCRAPLLMSVPSNYLTTCTKADIPGLPPLYYRTTSSQTLEGVKNEDPSPVVDHTHLNHNYYSQAILGVWERLTIRQELGMKCGGVGSIPRLMPLATNIT